MPKGKKLALKASVVAAGLACAGLSYAQSSIVLYGLVDAGLQYSSKTASPTLTNAGSTFGFADSGLSPSNFGIKGTEDLGGGLKAIFTLESGINMGNGAFGNSNGNLFGRAAWVGLEGGFGTVKAGLQYSPFFLAVYGLDPRGLSSLGSNLVEYIDESGLVGIFTPNSVSYTTPVIGGFSAAALYSFGGVAGDFQNGRLYSLSASYTNGTFKGTVAYMNSAAGVTNGGMTVNPLLTGSTAAAYGPMEASISALIVGGTYKIGKLTAAASYSNWRTGSYLGLFQTPQTTNNIYNVGADFLALPMLDLNAGVWYKDQSNATSNHSLLASLGANLYLSVRTTLYAQVAVVKNSGTPLVYGGTGATAGLQGLGVGGSNPLLIGVPNATTVGANIGIRHFF